MKIMKRNKGYTLIELLISLAAFSVIMLCIILMMRTSLTTYRNGLFETQKQTEAQIVANQIGDFIIDAKSYSPGTAYAFVNDKGAPMTITYDAASKTLSYNGDPVSDCVTSFSIEGLESTAGLTDAEIKTVTYDNAAKVHIQIESNGRTYDAYRDVAFRNNIENPYSYDISKADVSSMGGTDTEYDAEINLRRYEKLDLTKDYGVKEVLEASSGFSSNYRVDDPSGNKKDGHGYVAYCNSVTNSVQWTPISKTSKATLKVKLLDNSEKTFLFYTEAVAPDVPDKLVFEDYYAMTTNEGYHTDLPFKGIDVNSMLKQGGKITYEIAFVSNGTELAKSGTQTMSANNSNENGKGEVRLDFNYKGQDMRLYFGLLPNAFTKGFVVSTSNESHDQPERGKSLANDDGKQELVFYIHIGDGLDKEDYEVRYKYYLVGNSLKNASN